jgi:glycosyltransferase involved in cell wall biosynthesis
MINLLRTGKPIMLRSPLRIAMCPPELRPFQKEMRGEPTSATYVIQKYIAKGLSARGHSLTFVAPNDLRDIVCTDDLQKPILAPRTWSKSGWFDLSSKISWHAQRWLGIPYLNVFTNYRLFDACLQCFPGHDLVYERNGIYKFGAAMACKRLRLPYVLYFEADDVLEHDFMGKPITGLLRCRAKGALRYNLRAADCIICVSKAGKHHLTRAWSVPAEKIVVLPNAVDVHRFQPDAKARAEVRASLGVNDDRPLVIFVGNFYKWHDVTILLEAFAQVSAASPNARLVLVGDGDEREAMMQHATDLGLGQAVWFTGLVAHTEVPRLLAAADVAVVPYPPMEVDLWLSPLKLFEYMSSGIGVIASDVGQLTEVIQDGNNGLLVPPGDISALVTALQKLIGDPFLRARLARRAREDAVRKHSWDFYLSHLEGLFTAVIEGRPVNLV